tara:strand:+ start:4067 stop:4198 length:132 start_codon:yes stop_codon:yes gene_type:complete
MKTYKYLENEVTNPSAETIIGGGTKCIGYGAGSTHTLVGFTGA